MGADEQDVSRGIKGAIFMAVPIIVLILIAYTITTAGS